MPYGLDNSPRQLAARLARYTIDEKPAVGGDRHRSLLRPSASTGSRGPGDELHYKNVEAVVMDEVEGRRNVRTIQAGERERLMTEPAACVLFVTHSGRKNFDSHVALELFVAGAEDHAHHDGAAGADEMLARIARGFAIGVARSGCETSQLQI